MSFNRASMRRNHILEIPLCVSTVRLFQFVFAIVLLALSAYGVSQYAYDGFGLTLFTSLAAMIVTVYILVASEIYSLAYNYWAILGLDIFLVIFWLISFSVTAANGSNYSWSDEYFGDYGSKTYRNVLRATAVLSAIEFVMFIVTLCSTGIYLHRHRKAGGHCTPAPYGSTSGIVNMKPSFDRRQDISYNLPAPVREIP